ADGSKATVTGGGITDDYFVVTSPSYTNWLILRGFLVDGKPDTAVRMFKEVLTFEEAGVADK
ncbi:MAG: DUF1254 domain-containing protein, partial [Desulfobacterales bacterium]|nr:DUF1254 domain-containing protein [Desulfobacterales bacterium]